MSVPSGEKIQIDEGNRKLVIPDNPIIPFIEGDGIGPDIWHASRIVFDAAIEKAYEGKKKISWLEVLAGEKAHEKTGEWLSRGNHRHDKGVRGRHQGSPYNSRGRGDKEP